MDTISSRETNTNFLPMVAVAVGAVALILAIVALVKMTGVSKDINELKGVSARVESLESQTNQFGQAINDTKSYAATNFQATNNAFGKVSDELNTIKTRLDKVEAARVAPAGHAASGARGPVVAGPGEYIVKAGDASGAIIARNNGVNLADLMAVNPGVDWRRLHIGQKLKLPAKAGAQPAPQQPAQ